ncbi:MarR family transcriptional regulator [Actinoplanes oblitus]|uniref:MarR family transcriptional regulator n=1 Tax=Actinoplanes oblitus TaxID=3040509 RepID=A0ABY8W9B7_9ACTN|nr:MarR family transcriptional regulator [Actinoplanes oblitus]WIM93500.1 MarR family transcriptional regulator [Actinoplanes oblitus]
MSAERHGPSQLALAIREMLQANSEATHRLAERLGIGLTDAAALDHLLSSEGGLGPSDLGRRLGIRSASATTLVDRLHAAGHVRRVPHPSDRRRQSVVATDHARDEAFAALKPLLDRVEEEVARLSPEQAATTTAFLRQVTAALRDYAAGHPLAPGEPASMAGRQSGS